VYDSKVDRRDVRVVDVDVKAVTKFARDDQGSLTMLSHFVFARD